MPSIKRFCCFPKCPTRCVRNSFRGRQITTRKKTGVTPFLYSLLKNANESDFDYSQNDEICSSCEMKVRTMSKFTQDGKWKFTTKVKPNHAQESEDTSSSASSGATSSGDQASEATTSTTGTTEHSHSNDIFQQSAHSIAVDEYVFQDAFHLEMSVESQPSEVTALIAAKPCDHTGGDVMFTIPGLHSITPTERKCSFCPATGRKRIPFAAIFDAYIKTDIVIPPNNRCCEIHLEDGMIKTDVLKNLMPQKETIQMTGGQVSRWMKLMRTEILTNRRCIDFSGCFNYDETVYDMFLGMTKQNFEHVHEQCEGIKSSKNRCTRNALAMLLVKLRLNFSQRIIAFLFGFKNQSTVSDSIYAALKSLEVSFVTTHLGYQSKTREQLIRDHGRSFFTRVLGLQEDNLILIFDGTYLYSEKSSNHRLQRKSYCMQKGKNVFKPMIVCTADGRPLEIEGLWLADHNNNDARILKCMLKNPNSILTVMRAGDAAVVDRGFRDCVTDLESHGIKTFMPSCFNKNNPDGSKKVQFTTEEANASRRVTLLRRIVEQVNGRIKNKFHFFEQTVRATHFKKLTRYFRVAVAIINAFSPPLFTETPCHDYVANHVEEHFNDENRLMKEVIEKRWATKRTIYAEVYEDSCLTFPSLTLSKLEEMMLGTYQLKMGIRYNQMHTIDTSIYQYFYLKDAPNILRVRMQSRHSQKIQYTLWIEYKASVNSKDGIIGWYCQCKSGSRTLGSCSHISAVLRYLSYDRFLPAKSFHDVADYFLDAAVELVRYESEGDSENYGGDAVAEESDGESSEESDDDPQDEMEEEDELMEEEEGDHMQLDDEESGIMEESNEFVVEEGGDLEQQEEEVIEEEEELLSIH